MPGTCYIVILRRLQNPNIMKQNNLSAAFIACLYLSVFFCSCSDTETDTPFTHDVYSVTLVDETGKSIPVTKGSSVLPTGSVIYGTGYYANGDICTLSYSPASGYSSTCQWDWHDTTKPVHSGITSNNAIPHDYSSC